MDNLQQTIEQLLTKIGFRDFTVTLDTQNKRISLLINEGEWLKSWLPKLVSDFNYLINLICKQDHFFVDVNNYRQERERLIVELAKAAARKVLMTKEEIKLPAMNAYERRLVHVELSTRPDVKTESIGIGLERGVVVKPI